MRLLNLSPRTQKRPGYGPVPAGSGVVAAAVAAIVCVASIMSIISGCGRAPAPASTPAQVAPGTSVLFPDAANCVFSDEPGVDEFPVQQSVRFVLAGKTYYVGCRAYGGSVSDPHVQLLAVFDSRMNPVAFCPLGRAADDLVFLKGIVQWTSPRETQFLLVGHEDGSGGDLGGTPYAVFTFDGKHLFPSWVHVAKDLYAHSAKDSYGFIETSVNMTGRTWTIPTYSLLPGTKSISALNSSRYMSEVDIQNYLYDHAITNMTVWRWNGSTMVRE